MIERAQIIECARSWLGVPWAHQGRTRAGVDCVGLLTCVAKELGASDFDYLGYGMVNDPEILFGLCDANMTRIEFSDAQVADVVAIRYSGVPHHLAFLGNWQHGGFSLIHALNLWGRKVVEHGLDEAWRRRIVRAYRLPGVA